MQHVTLIARYVMLPIDLQLMDIHPHHTHSGRIMKRGYQHLETSPKPSQNQATLKRRHTEADSYYSSDEELSQFPGPDCSLWRHKSLAQSTTTGLLPDGT